MKNILYTLIIITFCLGMNSCKKFLTVTPKTQLPQDAQFSSEDGFEDALTGVYIQMNSASVYGQALTMTTIEYLVSSWDVNSNTIPQRLGLYQYDDEGVQSSLSSIFSKEYSIIANINSILGEIDKKKSVFRDEALYKLIKSEALALRAYCHFDLLRLFGPVPANGKQGLGNKLRYVTQLSKDLNQFISYQDYQTLLLNDLQEAEALSKEADPILKYSLYQLSHFGTNYPQNEFSPSDDYFGYRNIRMNYYAIKGLEARVYLWYNDNQNAYQAAKEIIEAKNSDGSDKFRLGVAVDYSSGDYVLTQEHLFGLYSFNIVDTYTDYFSGGQLKKGTNSSLINANLYGNTGIDNRENYLWTEITLQNSTHIYITKKYSLEQDTLKKIPLIRLSEMYLIAAETAPAGEAQTYWDLFLTSRNLPPTLLPNSDDEKIAALLKEYRKEFYAEGQSFFAYKRINASTLSIVFAPTSATVNYEPPLPQNETDIFSD